MPSKSSSGRHASRLRGFPNPIRPDDHHRGRNNGAPSSPAPGKTVGGTLTVKGRGEGASRSYSQAQDEYSRAGVMTKGSVRFDKYTDRGRSEATGGNPSAKSRAPISYKDREGVA
jgi:hypothetical protein